MTQTTQPRSWAFIDGKRKDLPDKGGESEDNLSLLLSVYDSLNKLGERLNKLDYLLTRKLIQKDLNRTTGEKNED
jgi:hypothetical protein